MTTEKLPITTPYIELQQALKLSGLCGTGGEAKALVKDGMALVNGEVCTQRGKKLHAGDIVSLSPEISKERFEIVCGGEAPV